MRAVEVRCKDGVRFRDGRTLVGGRTTEKVEDARGSCQASRSRMGEGCEIRLRPAATRAIAERLPEDVAAEVIEFLAGPLTEAPHRVGKPLAGPIAGGFGARRGTYRIIYRVDTDTSVVHVLDVDHRLTIYRRR